MIDLLLRMLAMDMEPSEPMGVMMDPIDYDQTIPAGMRAARFLPSGDATAVLAPIKKPRFRGIFEQFALPQAQVPARVRL